MRELTKTEMLNIFTNGIVDSFIKDEGKLTSEEASLISDTITALTVLLQVSGNEEEFKKFKDTVCKKEI